ncbi:hypothetical protein B9Z19DRAFT_891341, partial [Tuber borchii]
PNPKGPLPKSTDRALPPTEPSTLPQLPSMWLLKFRYPPKETNIHPNNTRSALSIAVDRYFIIASLICLFAFLIYFLPSS